MKIPYKANTNVRITSPYGYRTDPFGSGRKVYHSGIDFVGENKYIYAISDGIVAISTKLNPKTDKTLTWQWGNYVRIDTYDGKREYYCHLQSRNVKAGQKVKAGDLIGIEGATGQVTGRHLHFEVRSSSNVKLDASKYLDIPNKVGTYKVPQEKKMEYASLYNKNGLEIMDITDDFKISYFDLNKRNGNFTNYINGGFFAYFKDENGNLFTLPVANLKCDISKIPSAAKQYLIPYIQGNKLIYNCNNNQTAQFKNKAPSTLIVPYKGAPYITDINSIPQDAEYAISGVPTVRNGDDVDYYNYVMK